MGRVRRYVTRANACRALTSARGRRRIVGVNTQTESIMYPHERASEAFKKGYRDCRDNRPKLYNNDGTFIGHDYHDGWCACYNDQYWAAVRENANRNNS
jgi:hypothetical protein